MVRYNSFEKSFRHLKKKLRVQKNTFLESVVFMALLGRVMEDFILTEHISLVLDVIQDGKQKKS